MALNNRIFMNIQYEIINDITIRACMNLACF